MTTKKKNKVLKPEYPFIIDNISFSQEPNCCSETYETEKLHVEFHDGGGGYFYVLKTDRFAFDCDSKEYINLKDKLDGICKSNDIHTQIEYLNNCTEESIKEPNQKKYNKGNVTCLSFNT